VIIFFGYKFQRDGRVRGVASIGHTVLYCNERLCKARILKIYSVKSPPVVSQEKGKTVHNEERKDGKNKNIPGIGSRRGKSNGNNKNVFSRTG